jgi:hypothetical protein
MGNVMGEGANTKWRSLRIGDKKAKKDMKTEKRIEEKGAKTEENGACVCSQDHLRNGDEIQLPRKTIRFTS